MKTQATINVNGKSINIDIELNEQQLKELGLTSKENKIDILWKPKNGERYWLISSYGDIFNSIWTNDEADCDRFALCNCYKTEEKAEFAKKQKQVKIKYERFVAERNDKIVWDGHQRKFFLCYDTTARQIEISFCWGLKDLNIYATSEQILKDAIKEIGEDNIKKYIFEVE